MSSENMQDNQKEEVENNNKSDVIMRACSLAVSMMRTDLRFILFAYPLLLVPQFMILNTSELTQSSIFIISLLSRVISLSFLYIVSKKWVQEFHAQNSGQLRFSPLRFYVIGFAQWFLYVIPAKSFVLLAATGSNAPPALLILLLLLGVPALVYSLRLFFFFVPSLIDQGGAREILITSLRITEYDKTLAIKALLAPVAISLLLSSIPLTFSPDGRNLISLYASTFFEGLLWALATYLSLALTFILLPNDKWREYKLHPYRNQRFETLTFANEEWKISLLRPNTGIKLLLVSLLIWLGTAMRAQNLKPAPSINVLQIELLDKKAILTLNLEDSDYKFRGFIPAGFRLAGETGTVISSSASRVTNQKTGENVDLFIERGTTSLLLELEFNTDRKAQDLQLLQDLYLYYRGYKVQLLDMRNAKIINEATGAEKTSSQPPPRLEDL